MAPRAAEHLRLRLDGCLRGGEMLGQKLAGAEALMEEDSQRAPGLRGDERDGEVVRVARLPVVIVLLPVVAPTSVTFLRHL